MSTRDIVLGVAALVLIGVSGVTAMAETALTRTSLVKALAWQDTAGKVWLSWNDPQYLKSRYGLSDEVLAPLVTATSLITQALT